MPDCKTGLQHLIAKNEDEYVQLALQLASDVTALSNLRMSLRGLMSKSPVCDGQNYTLGLESTYRNMWHRYCNGDVPSLRQMEMLQQQVVFEESAIKTSEPMSVTFSKESPLGTVKSNGYSQAVTSISNPSNCEENVVQLNQTTNSG